MAINCWGHFCVFCCSPAGISKDIKPEWDNKNESFFDISKVIKIHILLPDTYLNLYGVFLPA